MKPRSFLIPCCCLGVIALAFSISFPALAEPGRQSADLLWTEISSETLKLRAGVEPVELPDDYRAFDLEDALLTRALGRAPMEFVPEGDRAPSVISLPLPDGTFQRFHVEESPILAPRVAAEFPRIKTYRVQGIDVPSSVGRISWMPKGFTAVVVTTEGLLRVRRFGEGRLPGYISFFDHERSTSLPFTCGAEPFAPEPAGDGANGPGSDHPHGSSGQAAVGLDLSRAEGDPVSPLDESPVRRREYNAAIAVSNDFYDAAGGNDSAVMQFVGEVVNEVSMFYERDLAIKITVVSGSELFDINFVNTASCNLINATNNTIHSIVCPGGQCSYDWDIGHLFDRFGGSGQGCAWGQVVCKPGRGGGVSQWNPTGGVQATHLVAHEMGHQFGAGHTYSGLGCSSGQYASSSAYEPGSGSTIMSYSGLCGADNIPSPGNTDYFHVRSIVQIRSYTRGGGTGNTCDSETVTTNLQPSVGSTTNLPDLPPRTEFSLTGVATDPNDPAGALTYTWEQYNQSPNQNTAVIDNFGTDPLFRSHFPGSDPTRTFTDEQVPGSILPTRTGETQIMRLVVRDNNVQGGSVNWVTVNLHVEGSPFAVTFPNGGEPVTNEGFTVTWDPGDAPDPIGNVNILLSTDNGKNFTPLVSDTANDGAEDVSVNIQCPSTLSGRIKIESVDGFVWDTSDAAFNLICNCPNTYGCEGGCAVDPEDCSGYLTNNSSCWDGGDVHYCARRSTIGVSNCQCDSLSQGGGGGLQIITPGCGQNQTWGCSLVPQCPAETDCGGVGHICYESDPTCTLSDTGFEQCERPDQTLLSCPVGQTVQVQTCDCADGPDCNDTTDALFCM